MNKATEEFNYDIRTYVDAAGCERWVDDNTPINQSSAFRAGYGGAGIDVATMANNAKTSARTTKRVAADAAAGINRGKVYGLSNKADKRLAMHQVNAHSKAVPSSPNWASMDRKV